MAALRYLTARLRENAVLEGLIGKREASMTIDDTGRRQLTLTETRRLSDGGSSAAETVRQLEQAVGIKLQQDALPPPPAAGDPSDDA